LLYIKDNGRKNIYDGYNVLMLVMGEPPKRSNTMNTRKLLTVLTMVALVGSVGAIVAPRMATANMGMGMGPGNAKMSMSKMILKKARRLDLSAQQMNTLTGIVEKASGRMEMLREEKVETHQRLKKLLVAQELDKPAVKAESRKLAEVQKSLSEARTEMMLDVREEMGAEFVIKIEKMMGKSQRHMGEMGRPGEQMRGRDDYYGERRHQRRDRGRYEERGYDRGYRDRCCDCAPRYRPPCECGDYERRGKGEMMYDD
jgi:Spy/CpxP family protein refolding chaperone